MNRPDENVLRAVTMLKNDPKFETVADWIKASTNMTVTKSVGTIQEPMRSALQGRAQELLELFGYINDPDIFKLKQKTEKGGGNYDRKKIQWNMGRSCSDCD